MSEIGMRRVLLRGGVASGAGVIACRLLHAVAYAVLARLLSATAFGEMSLAAIAINALALFPALGLGTALLAERRDPRELAPAALSLSILTGLLLVVVAVIAAPFVAQVYGDVVGGLVAVIGLTLGFRSVAAVTSALLDRALRFRVRALAEVLGGLSFLVVSVTLASGGLGSRAIAWGLVAAAATPTVFQLAVTRVRPVWSLKSLRALSPTAGVGLIVLLTTLLNWVFVSVLPLLVEGRFGRDVLGVYSLAFFLAMLPANALGLLSGRLALPALVRAREAGICAAQPYLGSLRLAASLGALATAVFVATSQPLVRLFYGEKYLGAAGILPILAFYSFARVLGGLAGPALLATGRARVAMLFVALQDLLALPLAWFVVPASAGPEGLVLVFTAAAVLGCTGALVWGTRCVGCAPREVLRAAFAPVALIVAPPVLMGWTAGEAGRLAGLALGVSVGAWLAWGEWSRLVAPRPALQGGA